MHSTREKQHCRRCRASLPIDAFPARAGHGRRTSCVDCVREERREERVREAIRAPKRAMLIAAQKRARAASVAFELREEDIDIPELCPVLGLRLEVARGRRGPRDASPTIDRITPSRGYVRGNVVVVSWRANRLKNDATLDELVAIHDWMRNATRG